MWITHENQEPRAINLNSLSNLPFKDTDYEYRDGKHIPSNFYIIFKGESRRKWIFKTEETRDNCLENIMKLIQVTEV